MRPCAPNGFRSNDLLIHFGSLSRRRNSVVAATAAAFHNTVGRPVLLWRAKKEVPRTGRDLGICRERERERERKERRENERISRHHPGADLFLKIYKGTHYWKWMEESRMDGQRPTLTRGTEIYAHSTRIKQIPFILFINAHNSEPPKRVVPARTGAPLLPGRLLWFYRLPTHQVDNNETETTSKHLTVFSFHSADIDRVACWTAWASAFLIENSFKQKKKKEQPAHVGHMKKKMI